MLNFSKIPFVRLLFPFITGILCCRGFNFNFDPVYLLFAVSFLVILTYYISLRNPSQGNSRIFLITSDIFLFISACVAFNQINPLHQKNHFGQHVSNEKINWVGEIIDLPKESEKFQKVVLNVKTLTVVGRPQNVNGKVLAYFKKPADKKSFSPGVEIKVLSSFISIPEPLNPYEFDYKKHMADKGVFYQCFIGSDNYEVTKNKPVNSLFVWGKKLKLQIVESFYEGNLSKDAANFCAAILTGYDEEINPETINAFAHSGTLHVLSVSGLHTGIIFAITLFLLGLADKYDRFKKIKLIVLLLVLWTFVFIAGFSPPVLRASIMLSLIAIGKYYYDYFRNVSLNILAVSAFFILVFDPLLLFDTGFLLSYAAVGGILVFYKPLTKLFVSKYKPVNKIWELCCVSIAAQISTLPITLYLFHQFPVWFVITNIVIIPLCSIIMLLSVMYLIKLIFVTSIINAISTFVLWFIELTNRSGVGFIDKIDFRFMDMLFLSAIIVAAYGLVRLKSFNYALAFLFLIVFWEGFSVYDSYLSKTESSLYVYHLNKKTSVDVKNKNCLYSYADVSDKEYNFHLRNNHTRFNYPETLNIPFNYVDNGKNILLKINGSHEVYLINMLKPDIVLFTNGFFPEKTEALVHLPEMIVSDGSCNYRTVKKIKEFCDLKHVYFYSTRENGYLKLSL